MQQSVTVSPQQDLQFTLIQQKQGHSQITITNQSNQKAIYKIMTTQPAQFIVSQPNGIIETGQSVQIGVQSNAIPTAAYAQVKFLVKTALMEEDQDPAQFWNKCDNTKIQTIKLSGVLVDEKDQETIDE